jgi:hypothetical protein
VVFGRVPSDANTNDSPSCPPPTRSFPQSLSPPGSRGDPLSSSAGVHPSQAASSAPISLPGLPNGRNAYCSPPEAPLTTVFYLELHQLAFFETAIAVTCDLMHVHP